MEFLDQNLKLILICVNSYLQWTYENNISLQLSRMIKYKITCQVMLTIDYNYAFNQMKIEY